jgi:beta-glucosidase
MADAAYRDASLPTDQRIEDLLARMTLDEKLAQLGCVWSTRLVGEGAFSAARAQEVLANGTGHITRIGSSTALRPRESAAFMNAIQRYLIEETRLGIPAVVHEESTAGFTARDATQFPQAIGLAATFEPELIEAMAGVIREQMVAVGARHTLAPVLDVTRDPRWGRTEETYGEDPYLTGRMGVAYVRGLQTDDLSRGVVCTGKHFLGYGASEGGMNHAPAHIGPRELREVYAAPFGAAIREAGLASIMNAYNEVDGLPCGGSAAILDELLRGELDFGGVVVADYFTTGLLMSYHRVAADKGEAAQVALEAGLDVELPQLDCYGDPLRERVQSGQLDEAIVDRSVRRLLRTKFELGLFEAPFVDEAQAEAVYDTRPQRALARQIASRSLVLLKNEGELLPLETEPGLLALIGPCADDVRLQQGDYHYPAHAEIAYRRGELAQAATPSGVSDILPRSAASSFEAGPYYPETTTLLDGIRAAVSDGTEVLVERGCDVTGEDRDGIAAAVRAAAGADVAVLALGGRSGLMPDCTSGEFRDSAELALPGVQPELARAVIETGTPTVVVIVSGRVHALPWIAEHAAALVYAWIPGEEGGTAVADVLFGAENPAGRLPISLPRSSGQVPIFYGHKSGSGRSQMLGDYVDLPTTPLYPFGHGLSYTEFAYGELEISPAEAAPNQVVRIGVDVSNTGPRAGDEVVQLYVHDAVASVTRPIKQLVGFARVPLEPGQTRRVQFSLDPSQLAFYDAALRLVVEPGQFDVEIGASSSDVRASDRFEIVGKLRELTPAELVPTLVRVGR